MTNSGGGGAPAPVSAPEPWRKKCPNLSVWYAATVLSGAWTGVFMLVFFLSTILLNLKTDVFNFFIALWLSIVAEAFIRWLENCKATAKYSKPLEEDPDGDNQDFDVKHMLVLLLLGLLILCVVVIAIFLGGNQINSPVVQSSGGTFHGLVLADSCTSPVPPAKPICTDGVPNFDRMILNWRGSVFSWKFGIPLTICVLMRAGVYKRKVSKKS